MLTVSSLYKGLYPLWARQIPYTMMKFASFENIVAAIYNYLPGQKSDYNKGAQTAVAFTGGYLAGILCAIVSHPADVMVSKLNAERAPGESFGGAMSRIYKKIGFGGLWNGLAVRIVSLPDQRHRAPETATNSMTLLGHDRYLDWIAMDDLRLVQALHGLAYHRWRRRQEDSQDLDSWYSWVAVDDFVCELGAGLRREANLMTGFGSKSLIDGEQYRLCLTELFFSLLCKPCFISCLP